MPKIEQKQVVVKEIAEKLKKASSVVLVNPRGLTVEQDFKLRKTLREAGVDYKVYKNTMMTFAVEGTPYEGLKQFFKGPNAMAISYDDPTLASRLINNAIKTMPVLSFNAGLLDNVVYDAEGMKVVAEIPPKEELLAKLLGSLKSPIASFARVINAVAEK